jgi:hypothetical protein
LDTVFDFDGLLLRTFSVYSAHSDPSDNWVLFMPDGDVFSIATSGQWSVKRAAGN